MPRSRGTRIRFNGIIRTGELTVAFRILIVDDYINDEREDIAQLPTLLRISGYDVEVISPSTAIVRRTFRTLGGYESGLALPGRIRFGLP